MFSFFNKKIITVFIIFQIILIFYLTKNIFIQFFPLCSLYKNNVLNIVAHYDDDLLFMNPDLYKQIKNNFCVTTLYLTSGNFDNSIDYSYKREEGIKKAYSYMANVKNNWIKINKNFNNKKISIEKLKNKNIYLIFLRLPDGGFDGKGSKNNKYQSLKKLWFNEIKFLNSTNNNTYDKKSLIKTIYDIIIFYNPKIINIQNIYSNIDENHSDHIFGSYFSYEAIKKYKKDYKLFAYEDYSISEKPINLNKNDILIKKKVFDLYLKYDEKIKEIPYKNWLERCYKKNINKKDINTPLISIYKNQLIKNNKNIILKGPTTQFFGYYNYSEKIFWERYEILKSRINLIGIFINFENIDKKINIIDKLIIKTHNDKIFVYITPTIEGNIKEEKLKKMINQIPSLMNKISKRYENYNHILYGIWAEPREINWKDYVKLVKKTYSKIKKNNKNSLVIINGIDWGNNFEKIEDFSDLHNNIILDFHYYPQNNCENLNIWLKKYSENSLPWIKFINKHPIIIGEFGGVWEKDFITCKQDLFFIKEIINNTNKNKLNYSIYTLDKYDNLSIFNDDNNYNQKGEIFYEDLINFPINKEIF